MKRKFYVFNSQEAVKEHCKAVKTLSDLQQLKYDIKAANCNLTTFLDGNTGVYAVDHYGHVSTRWVFLTQKAYQKLGGFLTDHEKEQLNGYTVLDAD